LARVVQSSLFVSAINTLVQTLLGSRLPAVMGNSFYFLPITLSIVNAPRIVDIEDPHERFVHAMRATQGAFIAGSALNIILGFSGIWGIAARHVSPIVIAPVTAIVGLGLLEYGFPGVCCLCAYLICENQHYQHHLLSVPSLLQLHCSSSIAVS
jgi:xanthine/uracil permease